MTQKSSLLKNTFCTVVGLSILLLSTGCGRLFQGNPVTAPTGAYQFRSYASSSNPDRNKYYCSGAETITAQDSRATLGSDYSFSACVSKTSGDWAHILVQGNFSNSEDLCIYPVVARSTGDAQLILNSSRTAAVVQCVHPDSEEAYVDFTSLMGNSVKFDALYIVYASDQPAMTYCLSNGMANCPSYSYGEFR